MKPKLAPRHIIPTVCYALLFIITVLVAVSFYTNMQNLEPSGESVETSIPLIGLLAVGIAVAAMVFVFLSTVLASVFAAVPLLLSCINIFKRNRKLAIAGLIFDILFAEFLFFPFVTSLFSANNPTLPLIFAAILALPILSLVMNILNIKRNGPLPEREEETLPTELMP